MKKELRTTTNDNVVQITTYDERWYVKNKFPEDHKFVPSSTWIAGYYPKGIAFYKWLADKGWDEAEAIKTAAGDKGSKVHNAIADLLDGKKVKMDDKFINPSTGDAEELSVEEYECLMWFAAWYEDAKPDTIASEIVVFNEKDNYAGTIDYVCVLDKKLWIIDFKTSQNVWPEHKLQISSYKHALLADTDAKKAMKLSKIDDKTPVHLGIVQLNYRRNKHKKFKFTEVDDCFDLFKSAQSIWASENGGVEPQQKDYPQELILSQKEKEEAKKAKKK